MLTIEGEERLRYMKLQGRTLYIYFDDTMTKPDLKADLFYDGCAVKAKKFVHSGEESETQFWLHLSLPSSDSDDDSIFDVLSILCEVDAHELKPWMALIDAAIRGVDLYSAEEAKSTTAP